eukprot:jgi/Chlat1/642/Chrsp103S01051
MSSDSAAFSIQYTLHSGRLVG